MVVGDLSVAFGKGVTFEERFSTLIDTHFDQVQVANLGLQGCTAECMTRLWNIYAEDLKPDLLIIQASGNDVDQALWKEAMAGNMLDLVTRHSDGQRTLSFCSAFCIGVVRTELWSS